MAKPGSITKLANISDSGGNLPNPPLSLAPLPPEIVKAFPSLAEWEKQNHTRITDWVSKTNTAKQNT